MSTIHDALPPERFWAKRRCPACAMIFPELDQNSPNLKCPLPAAFRLPPCHTSCAQSSANHLLLLQYGYSGGDFGGDYNPLDACDGEPSPPPSTSPSPDAVYFGCYKDVFGERTMGYEYKDQENLTNEVKSAGERDLQHYSCSVRRFCAGFS